jgi:hemerythrin superfamily protein
MSVIDKVIAAVTPPETEQARADARAKAESLATPGDWLSQILDHHRQIEDLFDELFASLTVEDRLAIQKQLGTLLTGHSIAEEVSIYPAMAGHDQVAHSELAYQEQSAAKMEFGLLEELDPASEDYQDKLEHIHGAVAHHVYSEEGTWFPNLVETAAPDVHAKLTQRYGAEFARYMGEDAHAVE